MINKAVFDVLLPKCSGNMERLRNYLQSKDGTLIWTEADDLMLSRAYTDRDVVQMMELVNRKGNNSVEERLLYLRIMRVM